MFRLVYEPVLRDFNHDAAYSVSTVDQDTKLVYCVFKYERRPTLCVKIMT